MPTTQPQQNLKALIADLRAKNQLDEEVLRRCKKELFFHGLVQFCVVLYFVYTALTETDPKKVSAFWQLSGIMLFFSFTGVFLHNLIHKMRLKWVNFGKATHAIIQKVDERITKIWVEYSYEVDGKKYEGEEEVVNKKDACFSSRPPCAVGGEVIIFYRPEKPEFSRLYKSELQRYNLHKNKNLINKEHANGSII